MILDAFVVVPFVLVLDVLLGVHLSHLAGAHAHLTPEDRRVQLEVVIALSLAYNATLLASWNGQTLGKRLLGVRVVAADGSELTFSRAVWRETGVRVFLLGGVGGLLGRVGASYGLACLVADFFLLVMHPQRRALHDLLAGTRVIMAGRSSAAG